MTDIIKPLIDKREYTYGVLSNNIKYVLVYDNTLIKTHVSASVHCGNYNDYKYFYGIAHFIEHLLFMGSDKYPSENHFYNKINEYNGYTNAFTSSNTTNYIFDILNNGFIEVLDIFSRFFIDPSFNINSIKKEMNAVDSEHMKNLNNDNRKLFHLYNIIANIDSPLNTFSTGNLKTLDIANIKNLILSFYNNYYTTDNISICIISSLSKDTMYNTLLNTFGKIKTSIKKKFIIKQPFYNKAKNNMYFLKSNSSFIKIIYFWEFLQNNYYDFYILVCYLNNKSKESLYNYLYILGYINDFYTYIEDAGIFYININLTSLGYNNLQHINNIIFSYISNIKNVDLIEFNSYITKKDQIIFDYYDDKSDTDYATNISINNLLVNSRCVINRYINREQNKTNDYLHQIITKYINDANKIIIINSNICIYNDIKYCNMTFYDCEYGLINNNIKQNDIDISWTHLNTKNPYLNQSIKLYKEYKYIYSPILISDNIWYSYFNKKVNPLVIVWLSINNNIFYLTAKNRILSSMFIDILMYIINIKLYKLIDVGYKFYMSEDMTNKNITLLIIGYNNEKNLKYIINIILKYISNITKYMKELINDIFITNLINSHENDINNISNYKPSAYNSYLLLCDISSINKLNNLIKAISSITKESIYLYNSNILNNTYLNLFIIGSIKIKYIENIVDTRYMEYFSIYNIIKNKKIVVKPIDIINPNINEYNNLIILYYPLKTSSTLQWLTMKIFLAIFSTIFFNELRTNNQLGYIVSMRHQYIDKSYIIQEIQSSYSPEVIISKINIFNDNLLKYLENINITKYLDNIMNDIIHQDNTLEFFHNYYLGKISNNNYNFHNYIYYKQEYKNINIKILKKFITKYINKNNQIIRIIKGAKKIENMKL